MIVTICRGICKREETLECPRAAARVSRAARLAQDAGKEPEAKQEAISKYFKGECRVTDKAKIGRARSRAWFG